MTNHMEISIQMMMMRRILTRSEDRLICRIVFFYSNFLFLSVAVWNDICLDGELGEAILFCDGEDSGWVRWCFFCYFEARIFVPRVRMKLCCFFYLFR